MRHEEDGAFTLIELVISLAIIAALAALFLAAVSKAKSRAQSTLCRNNLRQIGLSVRAYAEGPDGRLPAVPDASVSPNALSLAELLDTSESLFTCPADRRRQKGEVLNSYVWNGALNGRRIYWSITDRLRKPDTIEPMLWDWQPWHGHRNAVFVDGHTGRFESR